MEQGQHRGAAITIDPGDSVTDELLALLGLAGLALALLTLLAQSLLLLLSV